MPSARPKVSWDGAVHHFLYSWTQDSCNFNAPKPLTTQATPRVLKKGLWLTYLTDDEEWPHSSERINLCIRYLVTDPFPHSLFCLQQPVIWGSVSPSKGRPKTPIKTGGQLGSPWFEGPSCSLWQEVLAFSSWSRSAKQAQSEWGGHWQKRNALYTVDSICLKVFFIHVYCGVCTVASSFWTQILGHQVHRLWPHNSNSRIRIQSRW